MSILARLLARIQALLGTHKSLPEQRTLDDLTDEHDPDDE